MYIYSPVHVQIVTKVIHALYLLDVFKRPMEISWIFCSTKPFFRLSVLCSYPTCIRTNVHQIQYADEEREANKAGSTDRALRAAAAISLRLPPTPYGVVRSADGNRKLPLIKNAHQQGRPWLLSRKIESKRISTS